jgi:hypothetical protein
MRGAVGMVVSPEELAAPARRMVLEGRTLGDLGRHLRALGGWVLPIHSP